MVVPSWAATDAVDPGVTVTMFCPDEPMAKAEADPAEVNDFDRPPNPLPANRGSGT